MTSLPIVCLMALLQLEFEEQRSGTVMDGPSWPLDTDSAEDNGSPDDFLEADSDLTDWADTEQILAVQKRQAEVYNAEGLRCVQDGQYPDALAAFASAYELNPNSDEIVNNYGYAYYLVGNTEEALRYYREAIQINPRRQVAYLNLSDLLVKRVDSDSAALAEAQQALMKARELMGKNPRVILRQARLEVLLGNIDAAERFYNAYVALRSPTDRLKIEMGDFYRDNDRADAAKRWYRQVEGKKYEDLATARVFEMEVEEQKLKFGWQGPSIPQKARRLLERGNEAFSRKQYERAERLLTDALKIAPTYFDAMAAYGDLLFRLGRHDDAELYYLRSLSSSREDAGVYASLARLYLWKRDKEPKTALAVMFFRRALELRPQWYGLNLELAIALRQSGDPHGALAHLNHYLDNTNTETKERSRAARLKRSLEKLILPENVRDTPKNDVSRGLLNEHDSIDDRLKETLKTVQLYMQKGQMDSAMALLNSVSDEHQSTYVRNLESRILLATGQTEKAVKAMTASLRLLDAQPIVHEQLGVTLLEMGHRASALGHLQRAESLGSHDATYLVAKEMAGSLERRIRDVVIDIWRIRQLLLAQRRVERFVASDMPSIYEDDAKRLRDSLHRRFRYIGVVAIVVLLAISAGLFWLIRRKWGGSDLNGLVQACPESAIHIQRVLSAIRHEVLKHNTMMLSGLVEAMETQEDVQERVAHFCRQMLGNEANGGVAARLDNYMTQLVTVGNMYRKRLNLARKDAAMAPLIKGMGMVTACGPWLTHYDRLSRKRQLSLTRRLKRASTLLNVDGYEAVRLLLDKLRTLRVDNTLLQAIFKRCCMEPSFVGLTVAPLNVRFTGVNGSCLYVQVPGAAFEDIVANLVRNAIQSTLLFGHADRPIVVEMEVKKEVDTVTGIERMVLLVKDTAQKELTAEMLRGRYIEEGLGLTADLVTMYDGTLDVIPVDGAFVKAVIVKLPIAETDNE